MDLQKLRKALGIDDPRLGHPSGTIEIRRIPWRVWLAECPGIAACEFVVFDPDTKTRLTALVEPPYSDDPDAWRKLLEDRVCECMDDLTRLVDRSRGFAPMKDPAKPLPRFRL